MSIQDIQEEERQLEEAIQKSKQEILRLENNEIRGHKYSERVLERMSPSSANKNEDQSRVNAISKVF